MGKSTIKKGMPSNFDDARLNPVQVQDQEIAEIRKIPQTAAPAPEDLLGYYIFTTYHLLLKEIRNEAGDTEIVAQRTQGPAKESGEEFQAAPFSSSNKLNSAVPGPRPRERYE